MVFTIGRASFAEIPGVVSSISLMTSNLLGCGVFCGKCPTTLIQNSVSFFPFLSEALFMSPLITSCCYRVCLVISWGWRKCILSVTSSCKNFVRWQPAFLSPGLYLLMCAFFTPVSWPTIKSMSDFRNAPERREDPNLGLCPNNHLVLGKSLHSPREYLASNVLVSIGRFGYKSKIDCKNIYGRNKKHGSILFPVKPFPNFRGADIGTARITR